MLNYWIDALRGALEDCGAALTDQQVEAIAKCLEGAAETEAILSVEITPFKEVRVQRL